MKDEDIKVGDKVFVEYHGIIYNPTIHKKTEKLCKFDNKTIDTFFTLILDEQTEMPIKVKTIGFRLFKTKKEVVDNFVEMNS